MADVIETSPGVDEDTEKSIWDLYEATGNMAQVARELDLPYWRVRKVLMSDQIRLSDVQASRAEEYVARWEKPEKRCADLASRMLDVMDGVLAHIQSCKEQGDLTDLRDKDGERMDVTSAYQWLLYTKQLDAIVKLGFMSAKTTESMRAHLLDRVSVKRVANQSDPSEMSDEELEHQLHALAEQGFDLPWGVKAWMEARRRALPHGQDTTEQSG